MCAFYASHEWEGKADQPSFFSASAFNRRRGRGGFFFCLAAHDCSDGEVAIADHRTRAFGQRHCRDVNRVADVGAGKIDNDLFRNLVGLALQLNRVAHDVERAAALDAGRGFLVLEVNDDVDGDLGVFLNAVEVDVDRFIGHRMKLDRARNHRLLFALVIEFDHV